MVKLTFFQWNLRKRTKKFGKKGLKKKKKLRTRDSCIINSSQLFGTFDSAFRTNEQCEMTVLAKMVGYKFILFFFHFKKMKFG